MLLVELEFVIEAVPQILLQKQVYCDQIKNMNILDQTCILKAVVQKSCNVALNTLFKGLVLIVDVKFELKLSLSATLFLKQGLLQHNSEWSAVYAQAPI